MPKIRATKRPAARDYVLKPDRVRMFLIYIIIFSLAVMVGFGFRWLISRSSFNAGWLVNEAPFSVLVVVGGSLLMAFTEYSRWTLRVVGGEHIEGPAGMFGDRLAIQLKEIDWTRTRRSLASWLKIGNAIYANSRQRILVSPWFFSPRKFREMLDLIGYPA